MILAAEGRTWCGAVADLRGVAVDRSAVVAAVRGRDSPYAVDCPRAGPVHERAGYVRPGMGLEVRTAVAAAARSRGLSAPQDEELAAVREELASFEPPPAPPRTPANAPDADRERLRERVAELRGRIRALENCGRDASEAKDRLREAVARLSELETERTAAVQTRERLRERRDRRERRMRLEDRAANLARAARAHLVDAVEPAYAAAVEALDADGTDPFETDPVTAALAVLRVADGSAPAVLAVDRFDGPAAAARWLDAPVVRL